MTEDSSPRLTALFELARRVFRERADLRDRFADDRSLGYWNWLMTEGWSTVPELRERLPLPPSALIQRVMGKNSDEEFHEFGVSDASNMFVRLSEGGFDFTRRSALLDFGCGCGRLLRVLARFADTTSLHGCDVDADAIAWCREALDFASFRVVSARPPTPYAGGLFAGIYSYSVFSHLPEDLHLRWLAELRRISAPGAVVVLTTQGRRCAERFVQGETALAFPSAEQLADDLPELERRGFLYYPYPDPMPSLDEAERGQGLYGMAFVLETYVRERWLDGFELVALHHAPQDWQDYVVLRAV